MFNQLICEDGTTTPAYRYHLKGRIHTAGYKHTTEFAEAIGYDQSILSRVINGWVFPNPTLQNAMAKGLGITLRELKTLL